MTPSGIIHLAFMAAPSAWWVVSLDVSRGSLLYISSFFVALGVSLGVLSLGTKFPFAPYATISKKLL